MNKIISYLVTIIGIILILPLIGVDQLGSVLEGIGAWIVAIAILILGIGGIAGKI